MRWSDIPFHPPDSTLRQFAGLWIVAFGGLGVQQGLLRDRAAVGLALGGLAAAVGVLGLVRPRAVRPIFVGWMVLAFPIGWAVSNILMGLIYFGLFLPFGLTFRLIGRDPLALKPPPGAATYWRTRRPPDDVRRYFRQF